jgi:hypothetical protein
MPPDDFEALAKGAFDSIKCTLGVAAIYRPKAGGVITLRGVFDNRAQEVDPDTERPVSSNVYTLGVKLDDLPNPPAKGDKITIREKLYKVIDALEDGVPDASVVLVLHEVTP